MFKLYICLLPSHLYSLDDSAFEKYLNKVQEILNRVIIKSIYVLKSNTNCIKDHEIM